MGHEHRLFLLLARLPREDPRRRTVRTELIERYQGLVVAMARKYRDRGEPLADLIQVANVGLIKAVDGFDFDRGNRFTTYAVPMIVGELRHYFRTAPSPLSLDALAEHGRDHAYLVRLSGDDDRLELVTNRESLRPLLDRLPQRERQILVLRFYGNLTQAEVAGRLGISQVHVSRLQAKACNHLRDQLTMA